MRLSIAVFTGISCLGLCTAMPAVLAQTASPVRSSQPNSCATANAASPVRMHAPSASARSLSLCDGRVLTGETAQSSARPLALTKGDFNEDGVQDLDRKSVV